MAQVGNKKNSQLNGVWAAHVRKRTGEKRQTSKRRRASGRNQIDEQLQEKEMSPPGKMHHMYRHTLARKL